MDNKLHAYREEIRNQYKEGVKVKAVIYELRHKFIHDPQICIVVRCITEEEIKDGYRFGVIVRYKGTEYWVDPHDCRLL